MCTVTFIPSGDKFYLTSNRDEWSVRQQALPPAIHRNDGVRLLFPRDKDAGGTWITLHENGNAAVLLNGGFVKHLPQDQYRKSRGLVFLDIISATCPIDYFVEIDLKDIAPFTIILFINKRLYEFRWTGSHKHCIQLKSNLPYIWSSVTLYDADVVRKREQWFALWLTKNSFPTLDEILHFHQFTGDGDSSNDFKMNRNGKVFTVSITGIELGNYSGTMKYLDLKSNQAYLKQFSLAGLESIL